MRITGSTPISELYHSDDELAHHGVKGMKWGVRKAVRETSERARRIGRAMSAANIERKQASINRTLSRNKALSKRYKLDYSNQNKRYRARLRRLNKTLNSKVSDLSEVDLERGRSMYSAIKSVGVSVAIAAATTAIGTAYAPAATAAKLIGAGLTTAINRADSET